MKPTRALLGFALIAASGSAHAQFTTADPISTADNVYVVDNRTGNPCNAYGACPFSGTLERSFTSSVWTGLRITVGLVNYTILAPSHGDTWLVAFSDGSKRYTFGKITYDANSDCFLTTNSADSRVLFSACGVTPIVPPGYDPAKNDFVRSYFVFASARGPCLYEDSGYDFSAYYVKGYTSESNFGGSATGCFALFPDESCGVPRSDPSGLLASTPVRLAGTKVGARFVQSTKRHVHLYVPPFPRTPGGQNDQLGLRSPEEPASETFISGQTSDACGYALPPNLSVSFQSNIKPIVTEYLSIPDGTPIGLGHLHFSSATDVGTGEFLPDQPVGNSVVSSDGTQIAGRSDANGMFFASYRGREYSAAETISMSITDPGTG